MTAFPESPLPRIRTPSTDKKVGLKNALDIDNVVMDSSFATTRIEAITVKEIPLPGFRASDLTPVASVDSPSEDTSNDTFAERHKVCEEKERRRFLGLSGAQAGSQVTTKREAEKRKATLENCEARSRKYLRTNESIPAWPSRAFPLTDADCEQLLRDIAAFETEAEPPTYRVVAPAKPTETQPAPALKLVLKLQRP